MRFFNDFTQMLKHKCWQGCGGKRTHTLLVGIQINIAIVENSINIPQKLQKKNIKTSSTI